MNKVLKRTIVSIGVLGLFVASAMAVDLDAPAAPTSSDSAMYTLNDIYQYLTTGVRASKRAGAFTEPAAGPTVGTMRTLNEVMDAVIVPQPPKTGQTPTVPLDPAPAGSDGDLELGRAWPNPRFTDNDNGTVTDNLTGLIWLKNANFKENARSWTDALADCAALADGAGGLTDGSEEGDWRLPTVRELHSLIAWQYSGPALCNTVGTAIWTEGDPFTGVQLALYWSSTTRASATAHAWPVDLNEGSVGHQDNRKSVARYVWPVRSGQ